ncbi:MAG: hypothetical protein U1F70_05370 [Candidatus Competibacteraceae bacterium]
MPPSIADYTSFPEMMDGRLKTLHPRIHGGLLGRRGRRRGDGRARIPPIDLLVIQSLPLQEPRLPSRIARWSMR